ncbi:MAG: hypothetical protein HW409_576, partial [candidate division NC10 bacterium]|nr:hypothetical protein [candidate division NC10 bacterium]
PASYNPDGGMKNVPGGAIFEHDLIHLSHA